MRQRTILIIDDEEMVRLSLAAYLEDCGYRVLEAGDGQEGLQLWSRESPELVLTDLRMPGLDGFGVLAALQEQGAPIIALSGLGDAEAMAEARRLGARACLEKPILNLKDLLAAIEEALARGGRS